MSVNVDAARPPRRRTRGLLSRLFFGSAAPPIVEEHPHEMMMAEPLMAHGEPTTTHEEPPPAEVMAVPTRPSYSRPLPSPPELANDIGSLRSFVLPPPTAETDDCLLELLRQLCYQFLGGAPRDRNTAASAHFGTEVEALYQGAPPRLDLQDALKRILASGGEGPKLEDRPRAALELFYRHIMILIKALMIHLYMYRLIPDDKNVGTMHNWYAVLGHLESLRITLVHASEIGLIDLRDAPRYWEELIERTVDEIQKCLRALHTAEEQALTLKTALSARDKESDELRRRYDPSALKLELVQGERACALDALRNVTSVTSILHNESTLHPSLQQLPANAPPPPSLASASHA
jgi:hypothetical protein